jgi:AI-2 transport protein TqsA
MKEGTLRFVRVYLALLLAVTAVAIMHVTRVITVPVGLALFILILAWPLQRALEDRRLPRWACYALTLLTILGVFLLFVGILYICARSVIAGLPEYNDRISEIVDRVAVWPSGGENAPDETESTINRFGDRLLDAIQHLFTEAWAALGLLTLTATFTLLGLLETHSFLDFISRRMDVKMSSRLLEAGQEFSTSIQRYMLARTLISGATGLFVGLFTWVIGLDFPLVWAIIAFLLNYLPVLGSIISVIPPTIFGFLQPDLWMGFVTLGGLTMIQFTIGYYVDPMVEGRILAISPFVLLFSILFWGWVWGVPGALLGIPITCGITIVLSKFESTRWLSELLQRPSRA